VAAIVIEPELGEGGFVPAPVAFMQRLRALTERHGIVLVADEVQSGFGRTGKMFGYQHAGIQPDLVVMAKSLAAGLPLSAVVGKAAIMEAPLPGGLGGTYGGNPLACASALAVLDVFEAEDLVARRAIGDQMPRRAAPAGRVPQIGDVRGLGAMLAIELGRSATRNLTPTSRSA
jgi:4-aminobutyrate aminotransferase/(S)-3-amino-2-methylpropionate transaminase